jgi:nicotinamidase-related amidase
MKLSKKEVLLDNCANAIGRLYDNLTNLDSLLLNELDPKKTLIISVDLNNGFAKEGAMSSSLVKDIIEPTVEAFKKMKKNGFKIIAYTDSHTKDSIEFETYPVHCLEDSAESELVSEIVEYVDFIKSKESTNGFLAGNPLIQNQMQYTNLNQDDLDQIDKIVVTGDCTDICVYQFAVTLKTYLNQVNRKCDVIVVLDLIETYDAPFHNADLNNVVFANSMIDNGIKVYQNIKG